MKDLRVAVVHDWLVTYGGAERVLEQILQLYPSADLFALCDFYDPEQRCHALGKLAHTSFIQKLPMARTKYRSYLPFMPLAVEQFDFAGYDLVISSSHAVAHGVITTADQLHVSYFNNTMVYAWDLYHHYLKGARLDRGLRGLLAKSVMHYVRTWDSASAHRVDKYIANSRYMARRITKLYGKPAHVIYPPVEIDKFDLYRDKEDFYVTVSRLVPFKRIDLIVEAFNQMPETRLVVLGDGPELKTLKSIARSNTEFLGFKDHKTVYDYVKRARAFLFSSAEPFGIAVVEAQACGTPVIALSQGAAPEIICDGQSGLFFHRQEPEALVQAIRHFEEIAAGFDPETVRSHALRFSTARFRDAFTSFVSQAVEEHRHNLAGA